MQNDLLGKGIYCYCIVPKSTWNKMLGSVTVQGHLVILRPHNNMSIIETEAFSISCPDCHFTFTGVLPSMSMGVNRPAQYDKQN